MYMEERQESPQNLKFQDEEGKALPKVWLSRNSQYDSDFPENCLTLFHRDKVLYADEFGHSL